MDEHKREAAALLARADGEHEPSLASVCFEAALVHAVLHVAEKLDRLITMRWEDERIGR